MCRNRFYYFIIVDILCVSLYLVWTIYILFVLAVKEYLAGKCYGNYISIYNKHRNQNSRQFDNNNTNMTSHDCSLD